MADFDYYTDAGLTNLAPSIEPDAHAVGGSSDTQYFIGGSGFTFQANSNPGTDQITVSISGGGAQGTGSLKLATSQAGLDSATGGASLDLGVSIVGSTELWTRTTDTVGIGVTAGISISINELTYS